MTAARTKKTAKISGLIEKYGVGPAQHIRFAGDYINTAYYYTAQAMQIVTLYFHRLRFRPAPEYLLKAKNTLEVLGCFNVINFGQMFWPPLKRHKNGELRATWGGVRRGRVIRALLAEMQVGDAEIDNAISLSSSR